MTNPTPCPNTGRCTDGCDECSPSSCIHGAHGPNSMNVVELQVPARFWEDHEDRGLVTHPVVVEIVNGGRSARIQMTRCDLVDLHGDAAHYADPSMEYDRPLRTSARSTLKAIARTSLLDDLDEESGRWAYEGIADELDPMGAGPDSLTLDDLDLNLIDEAQRFARRYSISWPPRCMDLALQDVAEAIVHSTSYPG